MKTLLSLPKINFLGIYAVPEYQYGRLAGQFTSMGGGSLMVLLNKQLGIGMSGYSTFPNFTPAQISTGSTMQLRTHYGGLKVEYTLHPNSKIHVSFPMLIGGGRASIDSAGRRGHDFYGRGPTHGPGPGSELSFVFVQPGINLEANVLRFMKVFAGASYRIVSGGHTHYSNTSALESPTLGQLQGLSFSAGVKIGYDFHLYKKK
jgi:hypothetical protein